MKKRHLSALLLITLLPALTQAQNAWTNSFDIVIFNRSIPAVSPAPPGEVSITWNPEDAVAADTIQLSNTGNKDAGFTVSGLPPGRMVPRWTTQTGWQDIPARQDDKTDTAIALPNSIPLGFDFPYFGNDFNAVRILEDGRIQLNSSSQNELRIFHDTTMETSLENIRYRQDGNRFVVSWINAYIPPSPALEFGLTNLNFQIQLYKNGEVRYLYETMNGAKPGDASVAYRGPDTAFVDVSFDEDDEGASSFGNAMAILNQQSWISTSAEANPVGPISTNTLTVVVDNSALLELEKNGGNIDLSIDWDNGTSQIVNVSVSKVIPQNVLTVLTNPLPLPENAPVGTLTITNAGNATLNWSIQNPSAQNVNNYAWSPTSFLFDYTAGPEFIPKDAEEGQSVLFPLSFPFPFFGEYYTNFSISVNGYITLGQTDLTDNAPIIAPYMQDLTYNLGISKISTIGDNGLHAVTWRNMSGDDGFRQTFQIILEEDGTIRFQYEKLDGTRTWTSSDIGETIDYLQTSFPRSKPTEHAIGLNYNTIEVDQDLVWSPGGDSEEGTVKTVEEVTETQTPVGDNEYGDMVLVTNTVTIYDDPLIEQAFTLRPSASSAPYSFSPVLGTLPRGKTQDITVDARGQAAGTSATYRIISEDGSPPSFTVNIIAASSAALMDRDFDGQSDFAELLAGTNPDDAESRFSVRSASSANADGSRTVSWTVPNDDLPKGRTYIIWYTTNLLDGWQELATVTNGTSYTDTEHNDVPAIYYKVTIE